MFNSFFVSVAVTGHRAVLPLDGRVRAGPAALPRPRADLLADLLDAAGLAAGDPGAAVLWSPGAGHAQQLRRADHPGIFHAFGIFLLRQFYLGIPQELEEAADHRRRAATGGVYWNIILPLSRPILAALAVFFFLANWNSFLWPLTITSDPNLRVVQMGISGLQGQYASAWNLILAASVIAAVPTVVVFLLGQRRLVDAMKTTGLN